MPQADPKRPAPLPPLRIDHVVRNLVASPNVCDRRKARDVQALVQLSTGPWAGRFALAGAVAQPDGTLHIIARLTVRGLIWNGEPQGHEPKYPRESPKISSNTLWLLALAMRPNYPLTMPAARFLNIVPYNPHVAHRAFVPEEHGLPADLQQFIHALRMGQDGGCCFARATEWSPAITHDLALATWQVSRVLTGAHIFGESGALNRDACDHYLSLGEQGLLPLGPALSIPHTDEAGAVAELQARADAEDPDVEWVSTSTEQDGGGPA